MTPNRPVGLAAVFVQPRDGYGHPCQLSKTRGIRVCTDPGHDRDVTRLRETLVILGTIPDPDPSDRQKRSSDGKTIPARGVCPGCRTRQGIRVDGRLVSHKVDGEHCAGRYELPVDARQAVAS